MRHRNQQRQHQHLKLLLALQAKNLEKLQKMLQAKQHHWQIVYRTQDYI